MSSELIHQRRNLILITSIMWFLKYSQIKIEQFTILGIQFKYFENPNAIFVALWLIWTYLLFRYYQYFMEEGKSKIQDNFIQIFQKKAKEKIQKKANEKYDEYKLEHTSNVFLNKSIVKYICPIKGNPDGCNIEMSIKEFKGEIFKTLISLLINKSIITDYLFPIIFAIIIMIYCIYGWNGAII